MKKLSLYLLSVTVLALCVGSVVAQTNVVTPYDGGDTRRVLELLTQLNAASAPVNPYAGLIQPLLAVISPLALWVAGFFHGRHSGLTASR